MSGDKTFIVKMKKEMKAEPDSVRGAFASVVGILKIGLPNNGSCQTKSSHKQMPILRSS